MNTWLVTAMLIILIGISFSGCESGVSEIGANFLNDGNFDIGYTDTISLAVSTVVYDSIVTTQSNRLLVGYYNDEKLGRTSSSTYLQLGSDNASTLKRNTEYSYAALHLEYDKYSYYDTTQLITLNVYQVDEAIELTDDGYLYNTSSFKLKSVEGKPVLLGSLTFLPRPHRKDSVEIPITNELGNELYQMAINGNSNITSSANFIRFFKGLAIIPDTTISSCFLGFNTSAALRIYYRDKDLVPVDERYIKFGLTSSNTTNLYFNNISANRQNTSIKNLTTLKFAIKSDNTENLSFTQSGTGVAFRIEMPYLKTLIRDDDELIISSVVLEIKPEKKSDSPNTPFPKSLTVQKVNKRNEIYSNVSASATLFTDNLLDRETKYKVDVTEFVKEQISEEETNQNALLFYSAESFNTSVDRLYIEDDKRKVNTKVIVYYMQLK